MAFPTLPPTGLKSNSGPGVYRFVEQRRYLDALLEALEVRERVTLVLHDWGSGLGFDWANRHRSAVRGIAYMEAIVRPQGWDHWDLMKMRPALQAQTEVTVAGVHFVQEHSPHEIGSAVAQWLKKLS